MLQRRADSGGLLKHLTVSHEAMITWAMIALMTRRLTQPGE
jgi:hypothetical protein